jgi:hypothetical protein
MDRILAEQLGENTCRDRWGTLAFALRTRAPHAFPWGGNSWIGTVSAASAGFRTMSSSPL